MEISFSKYQTFFLLIVIAVSYFFLGYFVPRESFGILFLLYAISFFGFVYLMQLQQNFRTLFSAGLLFRFVFLVCTPFLSQDFYRFIWDGRLIVAGINPYEFMPNQIIKSTELFFQSNFLFEKMGSLSASHFSNYPPVNQFLFALSGFISGKSILGSILFFRIIIILADIGIYYFGRKILVHLNQNPDKIFWYFLNPLIIVELTGNLHFEGVMLFFLIVTIYNIIQEKWLYASVFIAIAISVKLLPLLLLPLFWQKLGWKKSILFYSSTILLNCLFFLPFLNAHLISNYTETISLWFTNFEFNASFYYVFRAIGYYVKGYNIIHTIGKIIPIITILTVLFYSFFKENKTTQEVIKNALLVLTIYFFISTTIHPWYVINLVVLGVFTNYKFPIVWSFLIILSYYAYSTLLFKENYFFLIIEYSIVFSVFFFEITRKPIKFVPDAK
jgi:alpha-1,6-mannosyltransferase